MNRLACGKRSAPRAFPGRQRSAMHRASDELISNFSFESQYGPIPLNGEGVGKFFGAVVCEEHHGSHSRFTCRSARRNWNSLGARRFGAHSRRGKGMSRRRASLLQRCPFRRIPGGILPAGAPCTCQLRLPHSSAGPRTLKRGSLKLNRQSRSGSLVKHDLSGKPVSTFRDHALVAADRAFRRLDSTPPP